MKKHLVCTLYFLLLAVFAFTQNTANPQSDKAVPELELILAGIGLPYSIINDSLAVIPYNGENIKSFKVIIQKISDLYIVYTNLYEALPEEIDETKYKYLLQRNDHFDIVKIGMSAGDNLVYVRADVYQAGINTALLKRIIQQVANVSNITCGDLM